ncbi:MAG: hypothetical protein ACREBS_09420, partial [Nitrososphaerales archaeon]
KTLAILSSLVALVGLVVNVAIDRDNVYDMTLAFVPGAVVLILSYRLIQSELKYFSVTLGGISLVGVILEFGGYNSSIVQQVLGPGGTERIIVYPILVWLFIQLTIS